MKSVYKLVFVHEKLFQRGVIDFDKDILAIDLDKKSLSPSSCSRDKLLRYREGLHAWWRYLLELDVILLLNFCVLQKEPLARDCKLLDHFEDETAEVDVFRQSRFELLRHVAHLQLCGG